MIRYWSDRQADSGSVHCFGNGNFMIYATGPILSQIQGPPYTMPSFCSLSPVGEEDSELFCESVRESGSNIWLHRISGGKQATFTDYMLPDSNVFFRDFSSSVLTLSVNVMPWLCKRVYRDFAFGDIRCDLLSVRVPMGTNFFTNIAVEQETWMLLTVQGGHITDDGNVQLAGDGRVIISAGLLPDAAGAMTQALKMKSDEALTQVHNYWRGFLAGVTDLGARLPADRASPKLRQKVTQACESIAIVIKCQQSTSGGVQAGQPLIHFGTCRKR